MISYAGNREDVLLARMFRDKSDGFYIDVGAGDPESASTTKNLYDSGWRGINVEPHPALFERLSAERPRDINLNMGVSDRPGKSTFYLCSPEFWGYSTFSKEQADRHRMEGVGMQELSVELTTLASVCEQYVTGEIDLLSVDVEGLEKEVLEGADWSKWRPRLIMVEATRPNSTIPTHERWEHLLIVSGYEFVYFDGLNRYYLRPEDSALRSHFSVPINIFDEFDPYEYVHQIELLQRAAEEIDGKLAAETALRKSCEDTLAALWRDHNQVNERIGQLALQYEQLQAVVKEIEDPLQAVRGLGPQGLRVAAGIAEIVHRFPGPARAAKRTLRTILRLRRPRG